MKRRVLIADDNAINRQLLGNILKKDYEIIEAVNGKETLSLLHRNYKMLSAVLLDIVMPEMDGYEVLRSVRDNVLLSQIPIIIVTGAEDEVSRLKALALGANDFILKPINPEIVRHCLKNNIALCETASILNAIQKDKLTGLYNREAFFEKVNSLIGGKEPGYYILSCFDIDNFKLINDQYGAVEGDRILRKIGKALGKSAAELGGIAGRISADNFAALFPNEKELISGLQSILDKQLGYTEQRSIAFSTGRYVVDDLALPSSAIYDRAYIAKQSVKGRYDTHVAYFDNTMLEKLVRNQKITSEMETAIRSRQFEAWFQPQYDHTSGSVVGAEALVRWQHPEDGIIPPLDFIPLFEKNGFIYEMDKYMWREVCRYIRKWMDEGYKQLPVSVNISRYDIFRADLIDVLTGLINEYEIPFELLRLEITESAFTSSSSEIVSIVKKLINMGFTVEIDDFGSGYSSLNTLKNVPAQVVKLDMRFLDDEDDDQRGGNILESIVRMTKWLGMTVLAEGVEEKNQADFLKSIGCTYVQGFLYARPMPATEYEEILRNSDNDDYNISGKLNIGRSDDLFWNPNSIDTFVFNNYSGCACVYEYYEGHVEMIRITDKYIANVFGSDMSPAEVLKIDWEKHIDEQTNFELKSAILESIETRGEVVGEYVFYDLPNCPHETHLQSTLCVVASAEDRHLVYCSSVNITPQREAERIQSRLELLINNIPGGIAIYEGTPDATDKIKLTYFSDGFCRLFGYEREEYEKLAEVNPMGLVFSDDVAMMLEHVMNLVIKNTPMDYVYRAKTNGGGYKWVNVRAVMGEPNGDNMTVNAVFFDVTEQKMASEKLRMSEEVNANLHARPLLKA